MAQFLRIQEDMSLSQLSARVGPRNLQSVLTVNNLKRTPHVGAAFSSMCDEVLNNGKPFPDWQRKSTILNQLTEDSDVFETAALSSASAWKILSELNTLPDHLRIPDGTVLPDAQDVLGDHIKVPKRIYKSAMNQLENPPHYIDPGLFNEYSTTRGRSMIGGIGSVSTNPFQGFHIPWGQVTLFSDLANESKDFPVYPEEVSDSRHANYTTMPDLLYQYEPWQIYTGAGPRAVTYSFNMHRDMWTGDHRDGKANELIRFCESNLYARYQGAAVHAPMVTLYVAGKSLIHGILTDVTVNWDGPIGLDGWYLHAVLDLAITEVSPSPLSYDVVRNFPLVG